LAAGSVGLSLRLLSLLILLAFFAAGEFALIRLRPTRVAELAENGHSGARSVDRLQHHLRRALVATQLVACLSLLALGWVGHKLLNQLLPGSSSAQLELLLYVLLALVATLVGGILPKAWVLNDPEASALRIAPLLEAVNRCLAPLLACVEWLSDLLLRLCKLPRQWDRLVPALSAGELESLIENDAVTDLEPDERTILEGVFSLRDTLVREVMVPRSGMVTFAAFGLLRRTDGSGGFHPPCPLPGDRRQPRRCAWPNRPAPAGEAAGPWRTATANTPCPLSFAKSLASRRAPPTQTCCR
jgi:CBS domain containing-hemolysin-like protein